MLNEEVYDRDRPWTIEEKIKGFLFVVAMVVVLVFGFYFLR